MILEGFVICEQTALKNNIEYDLIKSINDIVFKEVVTWSKNPTSLRCDLSKFGVWYYKKRKTSMKKDHINEMLKFELGDNNRSNILRRIKNFDFILSEYEKYTKDRYEIKCLKYGKENYEAYCMAKKQEKIQKTKEDKSLEHS